VLITILARRRKTTIRTKESRIARILECKLLYGVNLATRRRKKKSRIAGILEKISVWSKILC
jgi:hypothetical protein